MPLFSKDAFKEGIVDAVGVTDLAGSQLAGRAAIAAMFASAAAALDVGVGAVVESNFVRGLAESSLRPLIERSRAVIVECHAPAEIVLARYRERTGARHAAHFDKDRLADVERAAREGSNYSLELASRVMEIDTSGLMPQPSVLELARAIRREAEAAQQ